MHLLEDPNFWPSIRLTLLYGAISIPLGLAGSLFTAMLLARNIRGVGIWRTIYYMPAVLPAAATALLWRWMFNPSSGLINTMLSPFLNLFQLGKPAWFTDPQLVLPSYVIMGMWGIFGTTTVILLAGLKNIPRELYDSATVDGAGLFAQFRHVTLPQVTPTLFYVLVTSMIGALQFFTQALFITDSARGWHLPERIYLAAGLPITEDGLCFGAFVDLTGHHAPFDAACVPLTGAVGVLRG